EARKASLFIVLQVCGIVPLPTAVTDRHTSPPPTGGSIGGVYKTVRLKCSVHVPVIALPASSTKSNFNVYSSPFLSTVMLPPTRGAIPLFVLSCTSKYQLPFGNTGSITPPTPSTPTSTVHGACSSSEETLYVPSGRE